jgi:hypothetical protein
MMERVRRNSVLKTNQQGSFENNNEQQQQQVAAAVVAATTAAADKEKNAIELNSMNNQFTFSPSRDTRRPSILQTDTIKRMHSAVELNKRILEKSKDASLVLINIPTPPRSSSGDYNCKRFFCFISFRTCFY